jgi:hypothetical protein
MAVVQKNIRNQQKVSLPRRIASKFDIIEIKVMLIYLKLATE